MASKLPKTENRSGFAIAAWLDEARAQLDAIEKLPAGWNSNAAAPPDPRLIDAARRLLKSLGCASEVIPRPNIHPTPSGGVQFEWEDGSRYFEIEIVGERAATFLYQDSATKEVFEGEIFDEETLDHALQHIQSVSRS